MFNNPLVNHFIDTFSTNAVVPVVGWVEAIAETHHPHHPLMGFAALYPSYAGWRMPVRAGTADSLLCEDLSNFISILSVPHLEPVDDLSSLGVEVLFAVGEREALIARDFEESFLLPRVPLRWHHLGNADLQVA